MRRSIRSARVLPAIVVATVVLVVSTASPVSAAPAVGLGVAADFAILGGDDITNTGPSTINGDIGLSPGTLAEITGFGAATVNGTLYAAPDADAAKAALVTAYNDAAGRLPATPIVGDILGGKTLLAGAHTGGALDLTGTVTLDGENDADAVFVIQASSSLTTASASTVLLTRSAQACNVFWQVGSSATIGSTTTFKGSILALTAITVANGATIEGRLLARNAGVTLINDTVTVPTCAAAAPVVVPPPPPAPTTTTTTTTTTLPTTTSTTVIAPPLDSTSSSPETSVELVGGGGPGAGGGGSSSQPGDGSSSTGVAAPGRPTLPITGAPLVPFALAGATAVTIGASLVRRSRRMPRYEPRHMQRG